MKIDRHYFRIDVAAKMLSISPDDLIHLAAHSKIRLHVLIPYGICATPTWYQSDDFFAEKNLCPVSGLPVTGPVEIGADDWTRYEASPGAADFGLLSSDYDPGSPFQSTPVGIEFGGWRILNKDWEPCKVRIADCSIVILNDELNSLSGNTQSAEGSRPMKTLFNKYLCEREFGSAVLHVQSLQKWCASKGFHLRTSPGLDDYDFAQVESLLCAIERGAAPQSPEDARAIIDSKPELAGHTVAVRFPEPDSVHVWLVGAEAHLQWRRLIEQAIAADELQLLDGASLLPISSQTVDEPEPEKPLGQRRQRLVTYVNKVKSSGGTKTAAFKELAKIEGCSVDNITRIYYKKDSLK